MLVSTIDMGDITRVVTKHKDEMIGKEIRTITHLN